MSDLLYEMQKRLAALDSVTNIVGNRIRPDTLPQNEPLPAIRYELLTFDAWPNLGGPSKGGQSRVQFDAYGLSSSQANAAKNAVVDALDGFVGQLGTVYVSDCTVDNQYYRRDPPAPGESKFRYRQSVDFIVSHSVQVATLPTPSGG